MTDANVILKNAFIDAEQDIILNLRHDFSPEFESKMQRLIKSQKGIIRFVNTTGKRVACIILAVLVCLTTVACSIKEVREPILEEIEKFFVNAKELLTGTKADDVATLFPTDVTKIIGTSYISQSENQYIINDEEKIKDFLTLLSETHWGNSKWFDESDEIHTYWTFDFLNSEEKSVLKITMCSSARVVITLNGTEKRYCISDKVYAEMLAFTNRKFYLHDSTLERPDSLTCNSAYIKATTGLSEEQTEKIKKAIRAVHYKTETFLLNNVSVLKEYDSKYWKYAIRGERFIDPIGGYESSYEEYEIIVSNLKDIKNTVKDKNTKTVIDRALKLWEESMLNHDLEGLFKAHEYIHDYDYYVFNYPTHYVYDTEADFQGLDDYFGHIEG